MKYSNATDESGFTLIEVIVAIVLVASLSGIMIVFLSDSIVKSSQSVARLKKISNLNTIMANIIADYNQYPKWRSSTNYNLGDKVLPRIDLPPNRNGRYYTCISAGTSGASEPNWSDNINVPDGSVTWNNNPSSKAGMWKTSTNYAVGDIVIPTNNYIDPDDGKQGPNGHFYRCKAAGLSALTEPPKWPKTGGSSIPDGGVVWTRHIQYLKEAVGTADNTIKNNAYGQCPGINCVPYYVITNKFIKFVTTGASYLETDIVGGDPENILKIAIKNDEAETLTALFIVKEN
jgi:prepilin-type N-terminal cleavage/methylation domain-containing protein